MKKVMLIPLVATSALWGCQDQTQPKQQAAMEAVQQVPQWVGHYQGTTPCMGCMSRCDDCPGMAVALSLHENQTFTLQRESLSGHNEIERLTGTLRFQDEAQQHIELMNVSTRNRIYVDLVKNRLEIRQDETAKPYQMQSDLLLHRQI